MNFLPPSTHWESHTRPVFGFGRAINLLSAVCTALGCGIFASLFAKWTEDGFGAAAAGITAGLMSTVWLSATETEVYAVALLFGAVILWAADRAGERSDMRWALLTAYLAGLAWSLHLTALLVLPSAILLVFSTQDGYFAVPVGRRHVDGRRESHSFAKLLRASILVALVGMTCVLFMLIRARHDPAINQGNRRGEPWSMRFCAASMTFRRSCRVRRRFICSSGMYSSTPIGSSQRG